MSLAVLPNEWLGLAVVNADVIVESQFKIWNAGEHATSKSVDGEIAKEAFDHVEPRAAGGSEVDMKARMAIKPAADRRMFVRGVVVRNDVDLFGAVDTSVDE